MKTFPVAAIVASLIFSASNCLGAPPTASAKSRTAAAGLTTHPASHYLVFSQIPYGSCKSQGQGGKLDIYKNTHPRLDIIFDYSSDLGDGGTEVIAKAGDKERALGCIAYEDIPANRKLSNIRFAAGAACIIGSRSVPSGQSGCRICYATPEGGIISERLLCENGKTVTLSGCTLSTCPP